VKSKTKKIVVRLEERLYDFVKHYASANGLTTSELIRNILIYFHMGFLMGEFQKSLPEMKEEFKKFKGKRIK